MRRSRMRGLALVLLLAVSVLSTLDVVPAKAAATFTISRVWTTNCQGQVVTVFSPGQCIEYRVSVDNALGEAVKAQFIFDAYPTGPYDYSSKRIYYWNSADQNIPVNVGTQYYYSEPTVPKNAPAGNYTFKMNVLTLAPAPSYSVTGTAQFMVS
jgi:hypothetical protein